MIACCVPLLAWGAEVATPDALETISRTTWGFIIAFAMLGWAVSDLDLIAEWWNVEGKTQYEIWKGRLSFIKTIAASNLAGIGTYFLGKSVPGLMLASLGGASATAPQFPEMLLFMAITVAGYMGARWFAWLERKFFRGGYY